MTNRVPQRGDRCQPAQVLCTRAAFAQASGVQLPDDPTKPDLFKATLLTHGDTLCTDDREYQAFLEQPLALRNEQIGALRALNEKEKRRKPPEIMDVNRGAVEAMLREPGYPRLVHGHTHRPARHEHRVDGRVCERWVPPDWY